VIGLYPNLGEMMNMDRCIYMLLLKAIHGCVQASALWYALIRSFMEELGYKCSETDRCVYKMIVGNRLFILLLYVDNILAMVDADEAKC
jgi:hypothetical protein